MKPGVISFLLIGLAVSAYAHSPEDMDPAMAPWFRSLDRNEGGSCCNEQDCHTVTMPETLRIESGAYWVKDPMPNDGESPGPEWLKVGTDHIIPRYDNPTGKYVACIYSHMVLCFVQAAGG